MQRSQFRKRFATRCRGWRRRRTEVVVHGVDLAAVRAAASAHAGMRAELGLEPNEIVIGTVANYRAQKDYPTLLAAAADVIGRGLAVRFVAVGQGPLHDEIHPRHQELGLGDRFLLLGQRPDAIRVLAACDVFCLASKWEGLPVALMEALVLGLPVGRDRGGRSRRNRARRSRGIAGCARPAARVGRGARPRRHRRHAAGRAGTRRARERGASFDITRAARRIENLYREITAP